MHAATPGDPPEGSITRLVAQLREDPGAAGPLWNAYFARLVALARVRLRSVSRGAADEEDVALSAFNSFCDGVKVGRFPRLGDRDDLWQVLFVLTTRKAVGLARHETRDKRGGGRVTPLSDGREAEGAAQVAAAGPGPEEVAAVTEECGRLLGLLVAGELREVAVWKMEGYTNAEIAGKLGRSVPTVERKLATIRAIWEREAGR
jgi:DNA-directed RNA polymerase specialized sigma24 family protein